VVGRPAISFNPASLQTGRSGLRKTETPSAVETGRFNLDDCLAQAGEDSEKSKKCRARCKTDAEAGPATFRTAAIRLCDRPIKPVKVYSGPFDLDDCLEWADDDDKRKECVTECQERAKAKPPLDRDQALVVCARRSKVSGGSASGPRQIIWSRPTSAYTPARFPLIWSQPTSPYHPPRRLHHPILMRPAFAW
jgi:hypothetical protein